MPGIIIVFNPSTLANAPSPIFVTLPGIVSVPVSSSTNNKFPSDDSNSPSTISYGFGSISISCNHFISCLSFVA